MFQIIKESMVIQQEQTKQNKHPTNHQTETPQNPITTKSTLQNRDNNLTTMHLKVSVNTDASW